MHALSMDLLHVEMGTLPTDLLERKWQMLLGGCLGIPLLPAPPYNPLLSWRK